MSENPYETMMPPGPFGKAVDRAVAEANEQAMTNYGAEEKAADIANAARWEALTAAQETAGAYGVVLPMATVEEVIKIMNGEQSRFEPETVIKMVTNAAEQAKRGA